MTSVLMAVMLLTISSTFSVSLLVNSLQDYIFIEMFVHICTFNIVKFLLVFFGKLYSVNFELEKCSCLLQFWKPFFYGLANNLRKICLINGPWSILFAWGNALLGFPIELLYKNVGRNSFPQVLSVKGTLTITIFSNDSKQ